MSESVYSSDYYRVRHVTRISLENSLFIHVIADTAGTTTLTHCRCAPATIHNNPITTAEINVIIPNVVRNRNSVTTDNNAEPNPIMIHIRSFVIEIPFPEFYGTFA